MTTADLEDHGYLAHLDAKGFRYYIPAFMLSVLDDYSDPGSMRVISTLWILAPRKGEDQASWYSELNAGQRFAIARFVKWLPHLVDLSEMDAKLMKTAYDKYWVQFDDQA